MIKLQIHIAISWDGRICGAGLLLRWGTPLCKDESGQFQASPLHTSYQRSTKLAPKTGAAGAGGSLHSNPTADQSFIQSMSSSHHSKDTWSVFCNIQWVIM